MSESFIDTLDNFCTNEANRFVHPTTGYSGLIDNVTRQVFMSVERGSSIHKIYVRLLNEGTDVWRPILAENQGDNRFKILEQEIPSEESWQFSPGDIVLVEESRASSNGIWICVRSVC